MQFAPPLDSGRLNDQTTASSSPAAMPSAVTSFFLSGPSLTVASSIAQLPASPGAGRHILVPSFVNMLASPTMSSLSLPASSLTPPCASSFSLGLSSLPSLPSLQQPFIVGPGFWPVLYKIVSNIIAGKLINLAELLSVNLRESESEPQLLFNSTAVLTSSTIKAPQAQSRRYHRLVGSLFHPFFDPRYLLPFPRARFNSI